MKWEGPLLDPDGVTESGKLQWCTIYIYHPSELTESLIPSWSTARRPNLFDKQLNHATLHCGVLTPITDQGR
jgi:hypothetical protein